MYKVFIKDSSLNFTNSSTQEAGNDLSYSGGQWLKSLIEDLESGMEQKHLNILCTDPEEAWEEFKTNFKIIEAAGGLVINDERQLLMIFRLGKWDLPKGKIEKGEGVEEAAIREVEEECGIDGLKISHPMKNTYHTYRLNEKAILKITYWFQMKTSFSGDLSPQLEEDIHEAKWMNRDKVAELIPDTYGNIARLLSDYIA